MPWHGSQGNEPKTAWACACLCACIKIKQGHTHWTCGLIDKNKVQGKKKKYCPASPASTRGPVHRRRRRARFPVARLFPAPFPEARPALRVAGGAGGADGGAAAALLAPLALLLPRFFAGAGGG